jgi:hypothetical protein
MGTLHLESGIKCWKTSSATCTITQPFKSFIDYRFCLQLLKALLVDRHDLHDPGDVQDSGHFTKCCDFAQRLHDPRSTYMRPSTGQSLKIVLQKKSTPANKHHHSCLTESVARPGSTVARSYTVSIQSLSTSSKTRHRVREGKRAAVGDV